MPGGAIFMQSPYAEPAEVWKRIPEHNQQIIRDKKVRVFYSDMVKIAREVASRGRPADAHAGHRAAGGVPAADAVRQARASMSDEQVYAGVEKALRKYFGKRGDRVVQDNLNCVKRGYSEMKEIPPAVIAS